MARIGAALALTATGVGMLLIDAASPGYQVDTALFAIIASAICVLLGIEGIELMRKGRS
jgi:hypothetical protein